MDMYDEKKVLCGASAYEQKFYLNPAYASLPEAVKDELKIMCVLFTEDIGGVITLCYDEEGSLQFITECDESDLLYDDIGAGLKVKQLSMQKQELLESLELYYRLKQ